MGSPRRLANHRGHCPLPPIAQTSSPGSPKPSLRCLPAVVTSSWCQSARQPRICRHTWMVYLQMQSPWPKDTSGKVGAECSYLGRCLYSRQPSNAKRRRARAQRAGGTTWHNCSKRPSKRTETATTLMYFDQVMAVSHFRNLNNKTYVLNAQS